MRWCNRLDMASEELSHMEVMKKAKELVSSLLSDSALNDLPPDCDADEVSTLLALEQGRAITINLKRFDGEVIPVIVLQGVTVFDLMKGVEQAVTRRLSRTGGVANISWKYVWQTYWLAYGQTRLEVKTAKLSSYGIGNRDEVCFVKRLRREHKSKRVRRQFTT